MYTHTHNAHKRMSHALLYFYRKTSCFFYPSPVRPPKEGTPIRGNKAGSVGGCVTDVMVRSLSHRIIPPCHAPAPTTRRCATKPFEWLAHPASSAHLPCHIDQHHNTIDRPNAPGARGELHNHRIHLAGTKMRDDTHRNIHPASSAHLPCHIDHPSSITTTQSIERVELTGRSKRTRSIPFEVGSSHLAKASFGQHTQSNQPNCRKERVHRRRRAR